MLNEAIRLSDINLPEGAEIPGFDAENDQMVVSVTPPRAEDRRTRDSPEGEEADAAQADGSSEDQDSAGDEASEEAESND